MQSFHGTVTFVTGAGSGIGRALAEALAARGAGGLALADINAAGLEETAAAIGRTAGAGDPGSGGAAGPSVTRHVFDVTDETAFAAAAKEAIAAHGAVDIVINNAGQLARMARFLDLDPGEFERSFGVNFWGAVNGARAFVPHLLTRPEAALVNVSSAYGFAATPLQSPYIAGKFALRGLSDALRYELLASAVHVMCVHPGVVKTNLGANAPARSDAERQANIRRQNMTLTTAPRAARKILAGLQRRKARVIIGADGKLMDLLGRYAPARYPQLTYPLLRRVEPLIAQAVSSCAADPGRAR